MSVVAVAIAAVATAAVHAGSCNGTLSAPPAVPTVIASVTNPALDAWIVQPDCTFSVVTAVNEELSFETAIQRIDAVKSIVSVPTDVEAISLSQLGQLAVANFTNAKRLTSLSCLNSSLPIIDSTALPYSLTSLTLLNNYIPSLQDAILPPALEDLTLTRNNLLAIDFNIPKQLKSLVISYNPITAVDRISLPSSLETFLLTNANVTTVRGTRLPASLTSLQIGPGTISSFEIRESDFTLLAKMQSLSLTVSQISCNDTSAQIKPLGTNTFCVIPDTRFAELYGEQADETRAPSQTTPSTDPSIKSSSNSVAVTISCIAAAVVLAGAFIVYRMCTKPKSPQAKRDASDGEPAAFIAWASDTKPSADYANSGRGDTGGSSSNHYLANDVRNDSTLLKLRLDEQEVELHEQIAQGGYGIVYRGVYRSQVIAIKQLQPGLWQDTSKLARFMDEIRLCASLDHPKIVALIGITWTSVRDLSAVTEFMSGGDLHQTLRHEAVSSPRTWTNPWASSQINAKTQIALDVAEAVVYLHSFMNPILHRDLKAQNVLLDDRGNAKLSDFGISRELSQEETMTHGIGTMAWIAPEVLRGERYSEKADIYSFGVLLVEMDRCEEPYADQAIEGGPIGSAQLAVLVSQGKLKPTVSAEAPESIRSLAHQCLNFDTDSRPTAMAVFYSLHQIQREAKNEDQTA